MASSSTSASNPNPWAPYDTYKDCSQGICSIYCPQWCYIIFPPPPSFDDSAATDFSPLIIAVIGIIASAFILVSYYTIISKYCRRRRQGDGDGDTTSAVELHDNQAVNNDAWRGGNNGGGLDEGLIKSITVYKYKKGEGLVEESDCSVCLSEFLEDESLRLLPKCNHAFHLPCIDTWLKSHSNCPLCRANIIAQTPPPPPDHPPPPGQETAVAPPATGVVSVNQYQHRNDETVLVIHEEIVGEQTVLNDGDDEIVHSSTTSDDQVGVEVLPIRRSVSLNYCRGPVLVADILRSNEDDDDDYQMEKNRSKRVMDLVMNSPLALKRSISTGRFMFTRFGKSSSVNDSIIPN